MEDFDINKKIKEKIEMIRSALRDKALIAQIISSWASCALVIVTLALVIITAVYVYQTKKMVDVMEKEFEFSSDPTLEIRNVYIRYYTDKTNYIAATEDKKFIDIEYGKLHHVAMNPVLINNSRRTIIVKSVKYDVRNSDGRSIIKNEAVDEHVIITKDAKGMLNPTIIDEVWEGDVTSNSLTYFLDQNKNSYIIFDIILEYSYEDTVEIKELTRTVYCSDNNDYKRIVSLRCGMREGDF